MKQIEVTIMGQNYVLGCPQGSEQPLLGAVSRVDAEMTAIRDAGRVRARERIAVLAALNLAFALAERADAPSVTAHASAAGSADDAGDLARVERLIGRIDEALAPRGALL